MDIQNLRTIPDAARSGPLTDAQWRWARFNRHDNGAAEFGVFRQIGRRVFIDVEAAGRWISSGRAASCSRRRVAE